MLAKLNYNKKDKLIIKNLNSRRKKTMTECCFDWLITNQKVACHAFAMDALYLLGTEIDWIHPELKVVIAQDMHSRNAGYVTRGRITLEKISIHKKLQSRNS